MPVRRSLLVRCDDAGSSPWANLSIAQIIARRLIPLNVSVMAVGPAFKQAAEILRHAGGDVCVGVHLTMNCEWRSPHRRWGPLLERQRVLSLVLEDGTFPSTTVEHHRRGFCLEEMLAEAQAQIDAARLSGLDVHYLDEHMGFGWLPGVRERLARLAEREGLILAEKFDPLPPLPPQAHASPLSALKNRINQAQGGLFVLITHPILLHDRAVWPGGPASAKQCQADHHLLTDSRLPAILAHAHTQATTFAKVARPARTSMSL